MGLLGWPAALSTYGFLEVELVIKGWVGFDGLHGVHLGICWYEGGVQTGHCSAETREATKQLKEDSGKNHKASCMLTWKGGAEKTRCTKS